MKGDRDYNDPRYKAWRYAVFIRDDWTCQECQSKGKKLNAHHIKRWASYPHLRYNVANGITLCSTCHDIVTGSEERYEHKFKRIIKTKIDSGNKIRKIDRKKKSRKRTKKKYVKLNPRLGF